MAKKNSVSLLRKLPTTYSEMVRDAIVTLKERNGSSQYAIGKFIGDKYKDLPVNFKRMLLIQLKKLVASDKLVKLKASYKLPSTAKIVAAAKAKKGAAPAKKKPTAPAKTKADPKAKPATKANPAPKAKPAAKANPAPKARPVAKAKPAPKAKPTAKTKPAAKAKTKSALKAKQAAKTKYAPKVKTVAKAKPNALAEPICHQQVQINQPDELAQPKTTVVTVKATYKNRMVKFRFEVPTQTTSYDRERFIKLNEEIAKRFQLMQGSFKLKYKDTDGDMITLTGDDSLRISAEDFTELGHQNVIILMVLLIA